MNFILAGGAEDQKLTAFLHDMRAREALDSLRATQGIGYRQLGHSNTFIVAPVDAPELNRPVVVEGGKELDKLVTLRVKNLPLDKFLAALSAQTKTNFFVGEGLEGVRVTVFLENVTAREALEAVMTIKGLECRRLEERSDYRLSKTPA